MISLLLLLLVAAGLLAFCDGTDGVAVDRDAILLDLALDHRDYYGEIPASLMPLDLWCQWARARARHGDPRFKIAGDEHS